MKFLKCSKCKSPKVSTLLSCDCLFCPTCTQRVVANNMGRLKPVCSCGKEVSREQALLFQEDYSD